MNKRGSEIMRKKYETPIMDARWFRDKIVTEGQTTGSVTAAQDLTNQAQNYMIRKSVSTGTVSTVKLESIIGYSN
ncbi:MAG: hypothetical protein ACI4TH_06855 [Candidatus Ornithomonoglobus sp.]